jgi:hypothetical protein
MTQNEDVLKYLEKHGTITQLEALRELGIMRLASRISDLKKGGEQISRKMIEVRARNGRKAYVAQYSLRKDEKDV